VIGKSKTPKHMACSWGIGTKVVMVTVATGVGKSTRQNALIRMINCNSSLGVRYAITIMTGLMNN
jgi:Tfp pilus assembly pilus retraction ATPase PilT